MRIKNLTLSNVKLFGENPQRIDFSEDKNVTILLGDNGSGKTTTLNTLAIILSQFFGPFPDVKSKLFTIDDVHLIKESVAAKYLSVELNLKTSNNDINVSMTRVGTKKSNDKIPGSSLKEIKSYANYLKDAIIDDSQIEIPVLAFYGTERGQITAPQRKRNFSKLYTRWDCYKTALEPTANFKRFFAWFDAMEFEELKTQKAQNNFNIELPALKAVRLALSKLETNFKNPRIELHPLRFVMDKYDIDGSKKEIRIEQMSDGYRIMIAMVADIAARMAEANPNPTSNEPLKCAGIVLIDEIDLHLHPKWQRRVLAQLHTIFPNVQFIVSTHSPSVVLGALDIAQVIKLENGTINEIPDGSYSNYDVSLLLLSDLFRIESVRTRIYQEKEVEYRKLMAKEALSDTEKEDYDKLSMELCHHSSADLELLKSILNLNPSSND